MPSNSVQTSLMVWSATTELLQGQRQSTAVMIAFTRMVQQQGCARLMVFGMAVYLIVSQIQSKTVSIFNSVTVNQFFNNF